MILPVHGGTSTVSSIISSTTAVIPLSCLPPITYQFPAIVISGQYGTLSIGTVEIATDGFIRFSYGNGLPYPVNGWTGHGRDQLCQPFTYSICKFTH
jgi:hypothetical protein